MAVQVCRVVRYPTGCVSPRPVILGEVLPGLMLGRAPPMLTDIFPPSVTAPKIAPNVDGLAVPVATSIHVGGSIRTVGRPDLPGRPPRLSERIECSRPSRSNGGQHLVSTTRVALTTHQQLYRSCSGAQSFRDVPMLSESNTARSGNEIKG
jgi:hypothetical protein